MAAPTRRRPRPEPEPCPVGGVLGLVVSDDRAHCAARRDLRHRRPGRTVVNASMILFRLAPGALRGARWRRMTASHLRMRRRDRALGGDRRLRALTRLDTLGFPARVRLRDLDVVVRLAQRVRAQPVDACSTARVAAGSTTCSASGSTSSSAWPRSRPWPGRSSPAPSRPEPVCRPWSQPERVASRPPDRRGHHHASYESELT